MRSVALVLASLLPLAADARCVGEWFSSFPEASVELPPRGQVLVVLGGRWATIDPSRDLEFVRGGERVPAEVVSQFEGYRQRQVLVTPARALSEAKWSVQVKRTVVNRPPRALGTWTVKEHSRPEPAFGAPPEVSVLRYGELGCGPASVVNFTVGTEPGVMVEAAVSVDGVTTTGVFPVSAGVVELGHGMCNGGFDLKPGVEATVVLTPIDVSGTRGASSASLNFVAPAK